MLHIPGPRDTREIRVWEMNCWWTLIRVTILARVLPWVERVYPHNIGLVRRGGFKLGVNCRSPIGWGDISHTTSCGVGHGVRLGDPAGLGGGGGPRVCSCSSWGFSTSTSCAWARWGGGGQPSIVVSLDGSWVNRVLPLEVGGCGLIVVGCARYCCRRTCHSRVWVNCAW